MPLAINIIGFSFAFRIAALVAMSVVFLAGSVLVAGISFLVVALVSTAIGALMHIPWRHITAASVTKSNLTLAS